MTRSYRVDPGASARSCNQNLGAYIAKDAMQSVKLMPMCWPGSLPGVPTRLYTVYKLTNIVNGKIYIGAHETFNLDDEYLGSGSVLLKAIKKYGRANFKKEYLAVFDNQTDMFVLERELVNRDFLLRKDTYNVRLGGIGGFWYINKSGLNGGKTSAVRRAKFFKDPVWVENFSRAVSSGLAKSGYKSKGGTTYYKAGTAAKIGKANSIKQKGSKNSQFGTLWITDGVNNAKIKKDASMPEGWYRGRTK